MQKTFLRQMGPTRTFYNQRFMNYLKKTAKKAHCLLFFKIYFVFQRLIYSQNDFFLVPKRPIKMQKTFLRKMGPTRMFYDRQFLSYLKKTTEKLIFLPVSTVFFCVSKTYL